MPTRSKSQLALEYRITLKTFNKWLEKIPELNLLPGQRILTPKQVELIYAHLGKPN